MPLSASLRVLVPVAVLSLTGLVSGCAAEDAEDDADTSGAAASAPATDGRAALKKTSYVEASDAGKRSVFGAPKKIADALAAVTKKLDAVRAAECPADAPSFTFFSREGTSLAKLCAGPSGTSVIRVGDVAYKTSATDAALREIAGRETTFGDLVYGVTELRAEGETPIVGDSIAFLLKPFDFDQLPSSRTREPSCIAAGSYRFYRKGELVATSRIYCLNNQGPSTADANLAVGGKTYWFQVDYSRVAR